MPDQIYLAGPEDYMEGADDIELGYRVPFTSFQRPMVRAGRAPVNLTAAKVAAMQSKLVSPLPGAAKIGPRGFPLGFGTFTFTSVSPAVANLVATPQRAFKGLRLVYDEVRLGASGGQVQITQLLVGQNNQMTSAQVLPANGFQAGANDVILDLDPATPGMDITLGLAITALPLVNEDVIVSAMLIGLSVS